MFNFFIANLFLNCAAKVQQNIETCKYFSNFFMRKIKKVYKSLKIR